MSKIAIGQSVPDIPLAATGDQTLRLTEFAGKKIVVYFYPKDSTPGCTKEGQSFRDQFPKFKKLNTVIIGVSRDSLKAHENFKTKFNFPFELVSDQDEVLCKSFDVIKEKNLYGKKSLGIERSTFLIDEKGALRREWRKVKVDGHVEEVLAAVKALDK
jgi:peroxiredoxin Q/BCP